MRHVKRVLLTADAVGGVWTFAIDLSRTLGDHGVQVCLAVLGPPPSESQWQEVSGLSNTSCHLFDCRLEWMSDPWPDVEASGRWLRYLSGGFQPDVIHLNGFAHAALDWEAPVVVTGHSCVLSWWAAVRGSAAGPEWNEYARRVRDGLKATTLVTAPTRAMLADLVRFYGRLEHAHVIPNGRPPASAAADTAAKERLVLTAGRLWDEAKNVTAVCRAARGLPWRVCVAGDVVQPGGHATVDPGVECLGKLSNTTVREWMARASIYVLPAKYEPFGLSILEAASAGCALVVGDIPSLREVWGTAAEYVRPDDVTGLNATLRALIDDEGRRVRMGEAARARAREMTADRMTGDYMAAYATAAALHTGRRLAAPA